MTTKARTTKSSVQRVRAVTFDNQADVTTHVEVKTVKNGQDDRVSFHGHEPVDVLSALLKTPPKA